MRLRVIAVGRDRKGLFAKAAGEYEARLARYLPFGLVEIPASKSKEAKAARREEADRILGAHGDRPRLIALDVRGKQMSSEDIANLLRRLMLERRDTDLVIGGDEGLDPAVPAAAETTVSLGPMTLPHQLARVVLLEQLYRGMTIIRGERYNK